MPLYIKKDNVVKVTEAQRRGGGHTLRDPEIFTGLLLRRAFPEDIVLRD